MSDPNEQFNRGVRGQGPPSGGSALDEWARGNATRNWNQQRLGQGGGADPGLGLIIDPGTPFDYSTPPDPRILRAGLFMAASFCVFCLSAPIFGTLYPIPTTVSFLAAFMSDGVLRHALPRWDATDRLPIEILIGVVLFWTLSRWDHRAAAYVAPYRYARHVVRVILIALVVTMTSLNPNGSMVPTAPWQVVAITSNPVFWPFLIGVAVAAHFGLTKWRWAHREWDNGLKIYRLRPRSLHDPA